MELPFDFPWARLTSRKPALARRRQLTVERRISRGVFGLFSKLGEAQTHPFLPESWRSSVEHPRKHPSPDFMRFLPLRESTEIEAPSPSRCSIVGVRPFRPLR